MQVTRRRTLLVGAGIVVCLGVAAILGHRARASNSTANSANVNVPRAAIAIVKRQPVANSVSIAGEFLPYQEVELHAKVAGYIRKINVDIGDRVRTGQVLAVLEVPELNAQVEGADAGVRHSGEEIVRSKNEVTRAEADHAALHAVAQRLSEASKARPGLIAQQELDDAESKDRAAEAQVEVAKSTLAAAQQQMAVSQANKSQISAMQDYSRIVAPFDGVVTWRYADTGALVQAGTSNSNGLPVVKLAQVSLLRLRIPVPEDLGDRVHEGSEAAITVQATKQQFNGKVTRLTDSFDRSTRTMQVEIDVPNTNGRLAPGMYADVVLKTDEHRDALAIPVEALSRSGDQSSVLVLDSQNRVQVRSVRTGVESANLVEVVSGVNVGDRVIVGNLNAYQSGQVVDPRLSVMASSQPGGEQ
jgi:RND family efflux transporter MFP subunit